MSDQIRKREANKSIEKDEKLREQLPKKSKAQSSAIREPVDGIRELDGEFRTQTTGTVDKLERLFEDRVARALRRLGVPTREDLWTIARQLDEINHRLQTMIKDQLAVMPSSPIGEKDKLKRKDEPSIIHD